MTYRWTPSDLANYQALHGLKMKIVSVEPKVSKYRNRKTEVDGVVFDSAKEAGRYGELKLLQRSGAISGLTLQPEYELVVNGEKVGVYRGDFRYLDRDGIVVEDVKSKATRTPVYRLKKKLVKAIYGIIVKET